MGIIEFIKMNTLDDSYIDYEKLIAELFKLNKLFSSYRVH